MKKLIYIAASAVFACALVSSVYASDHVSQEGESRIPEIRKSSMNDVYCLDAALRRAKEEAEKKMATEEAEKKMATEEAIKIRQDKERGNSLGEELIEKVGSDKLLELVPDGLTIELPTGVTTQLTFDENGSFSLETFSPGKRVRGKNLKNSPTCDAVKLTRAESRDMAPIDVK